MEQRLNFWVIGGDRRQVELAAQLSEDGHTVYAFGLEKAEGILCETNLEELHKADCVILPLPAEGPEGELNAPLAEGVILTADVLGAMEPGQLLCAGKISKALRRQAEESGLLVSDYFAREELTIANAVPTAEGAVQIAMEELPFTLHCARVLVIGYGRVGRVTAQRFAALGAGVSVAARSHEQLAWASVWGYRTEHVRRLIPWLCSYDLVVNTVPAPVLGREELAALKPGTPVIDLASRPGGVDFHAAEELGVRTIWALALPGKVAPRSAAGYIKSTVYHIIDELGA